MASLLKRMGSEVIPAADVEQAMDYLVSGAPCDLVLADIVMPGAWGLELGSRGRQVRPGLPIVFVSGYADGISAAIEAGEIPLQKPVTWVRLKQVIQEALADSRPR